MEVESQEFLSFLPFLPPSLPFFSSFLPPFVLSLPLSYLPPSLNILLRRKLMYRGKGTGLSVRRLYSYLECQTQMATSQENRALWDLMRCFVADQVIL